MHDAIVIGGSFAGLAAATQLGRARRDVLVLDTGLPRNRYAKAAHGFLGQDGQSPAAILDTARSQLGAYDTVILRHAEAISARRVDEGFAVDLAGGDSVAASRLILAHGVTDTLQDIPGLAACWGLSVLHCPYCHGFEVADRRLGLLIRHGAELHLARLFRDWSHDLTFFTNGAPVDDTVREGLAELSVKLVETAVLRLDHQEGQLRAVVTADSKVPIDALFAHPASTFSSHIGIDLGCAIEEGPLGPYYSVDNRRQTSVAGVYAAGDIAGPAPNLSFAVADGAGAGIACHQSLLED